MKTFNIQEKQLAQFLRRIEAGYPDNPYHNRCAAGYTSPIFIVWLGKEAGADSLPSGDHHDSWRPDPKTLVSQLPKASHFR